MSSFCNFSVIGNLVKDPEVRYFGTGLAIAKYTVASTRSKRDKEGKGTEETSFIPVTTFGKQAENDKKFLSKGSKVAVKGDLVSWYDKASNKGGFNFEATEVMYIAKAKPSEEVESESTPAPAADEEWAAAYKAVEAGQG